MNLELRNSRMEKGKIASIWKQKIPSNSFFNSLYVESRYS
jgi:hypothetical protein